MLKTVVHPSLGEVIFHRVKGHVTKKNQNKLEEILTGPDFQWVYTPETVKNKPKSLRHFEDISILGHNFIVDGKLNSNFFEPITSLMGVSDLITN